MPSNNFVSSNNDGLSVNNFLGKKVGRFIVFEGLDGAGRSTQIEKVKSFLIDKGLEVVTTKEPTIDSESGRKIKNILQNKIETEPIELQKLYAQDRKEHLENKVVPALKEGKTVISDRYFFSTFAYGTAHGGKLEDLIRLNSDFLYPDLIILFKIDAKTCIERIEGRGEPKEFFEKQEMLKKVGQVYEMIAKNFKNFYIINAQNSIEEVFEQIKDIILKKL